MTMAEEMGRQHGQLSVKAGARRFDVTNIRTMRTTFEFGGPSVPPM